MKSSGHADEIRGIASRTIMRSHLPETLRNCRCLSKIWTQAEEALRFFGERTLEREAATRMLRKVARTALELAVWRTDHVGPLDR